MAKVDLSTRDFEIAELEAQKRAPRPTMLPAMAGFVGCASFSAAILIFQSVAGLPVGAHFWAEAVAALIGFGAGYLLNLERWNQYSRALDEELQKRKEQIKSLAG